MSIHTDLMKTWELLKRLPPVPVAIWLIDREAWYYRLLDLFPPGALAPAYRGIDVYRWHLTDINERIDGLREEGWTEERIDRVYPFREPGVWVEMNKGPHIRIKDWGW